jgi:hypothetical protein
MNDITFSMELVRSYLQGKRDYEAAQALVAFEVVMEAYEAIAQMLQGAIEREHDAALALSALRHPSDTVDQLKATLRKLADLELGGEPISPAFEQVMDELIAEVRLECASPLVGTAERRM